MSSSFSIGSWTVTPLVVTGYEAQREVRTVFNPVLGARATVAAAFPAGMRSGTLTAVFTNQTDASALDSMLGGTQPITFADSDVSAVNMLFLADRTIRVYQADADSLNSDGTVTTFWYVELGYQEVNA